MKTDYLCTQQIGTFATAMSHLLRGGISAADALAILQEDETDPQLRSLWDKLLQDMDAGIPFAQTLTASGRFPPYVCTLLTVGQYTGKSQETINHKGIARTFQNIRLFNNMTVIRNVLVGLHNQPEFKCSMIESMFRLPRHFRCEKAMREKAKTILRVVGLEEERNYLSCNLPYGKQRKLEIARALATNPKLLLLDEPAAGMNPNETADLMNIITRIRDEYDMTILLIEHDMKFVSGLCDEVTVLNFGTVLAQGDTKIALNDPEVIKAYIGG